MEPQINPGMQAPAPTAPMTPPPPAYSPVQTPAPKPEKKVGPIVTTLVIILIVVIAILYLFASRINKAEDTAPLTQEAATMTAVSTADTDDVSGLEAELESSTAGLENENI